MNLYMHTHHTLTLTLTLTLTPQAGDVDVRLKKLRLYFRIFKRMREEEAFGGVHACLPCVAFL
jgi:hypothetical protein